MSILMAVERMNWARRFTVADGTSPEANELLAAGYFEKAKMGVCVLTDTRVPNG